MGDELLLSNVYVYKYHEFDITFDFTFFHVIESHVIKIILKVRNEQKSWIATILLRPNTTKNAVIVKFCEDNNLQ